jgi:hypothetical protein
MKTYTQEEVAAAKTRNTPIHHVAGVGAGGTVTVHHTDPAPNASDRFAQYVDTMVAEGISFADAHYTLNGVHANRPDESVDCKRQLTADQQRELLEFVREHEEWDRQEREAEQAAETARREQYEALKAEFEPEEESHEEGD